MKQLFSPDSPIMALLSHVGNLLLLNFLWLVGCLPIFTIGASTTAMYRVLLKQLDGEGGAVCTAFIQAFRENFKKSTAIFLILLIPFLLLAADCWILLSGILDASILKVVVQICTLLPAVFLLFITTHVYPLTATFENTVLRTIKNAAVLSIAHLPQTVVMAALNALPLLLLFFLPELFLMASFLLLVISGALIALLNSMIIRKVLKNYKDLSSNEE